MDTNKSNAAPVEGQADDLDRGASKALENALDEREEAVRDDEHERPPHDRSPLT